MNELAVSPVSSQSSRLAHSSTVSPNSRWPPARDQHPAPCEPLRLPSSTFPSEITTTPTPTLGLSGLRLSMNASFEPIIFPRPFFLYNSWIRLATSALQPV